jgi:hypothetical protein
MLNNFEKLELRGGKRDGVEMAFPNSIAFRSAERPSGMTTM